MARYHPNELLHYNPQLCRGYTLFSADRDKAFLIDMEPRFVHQWRNRKGLTNPELLPNGNLIALAAPSEKVEGQRGLPHHISTGSHPTTTLQTDDRRPAVATRKVDSTCQLP